MRFYIADAFTDTVFGGNPAGVVLLDPGAEYPTDEIMTKTAAELRYSETAFIRQLSDGEFRFRYFTPAAEVPLCGHATIASFAALRADNLIPKEGSFLIRTDSGPIGIDICAGRIMMDMAEGQLISSIQEPAALTELYGVMGLGWESNNSISSPVAGKTLHPMIVSTGLPDILLPVKNRKELAKISPDFPTLSALSTRYGVIGVHAFTLENPDQGATAHCRNFAPLYGIDEEAATGTANGGLTYYLYHHKIISSREQCCFVQGESMERPSRVFSSLIASSNDVKIQVGGAGAVLASGQIFLK